MLSGLDWRRGADKNAADLRANLRGVQQAQVGRADLRTGGKRRAPICGRPATLCGTLAQRWKTGRRLRRSAPRRRARRCGRDAGRSAFATRVRPSRGRAARQLAVVPSGLFRPGWRRPVAPGAPSGTARRCTTCRSLLRPFPPRYAHIAAARARAPWACGRGPPAADDRPARQPAAGRRGRPAPAEFLAGWLAGRPRFSLLQDASRSHLGLGVVPVVVTMDRVRGTHYLRPVLHTAIRSLPLCGALRRCMLPHHSAGAVRPRTACAAATMGPLPLREHTRRGACRCA